MACCFKQGDYPSLSFQNNENEWELSSPIKDRIVHSNTLLCGIATKTPFGASICRSVLTENPDISSPICERIVFWSQIFSICLQNHSWIYLNEFSSSLASVCAKKSYGIFLVIFMSFWSLTSPVFKNSLYVFHTMLIQIWNDMSMRKWFHCWEDYCLNALPDMKDTVFLSEVSLRMCCKSSVPVAKKLNARVLEGLLRPHCDLAPPLTLRVTKPKNPILPVPTTACNIYLSFRLSR